MDRRVTRRKETVARNPAEAGVGTYWYTPVMEEPNVYLRPPSGERLYTTGVPAENNSNSVFEVIN